MTTNEPCGICGGPVRLVPVERPPRVGRRVARIAGHKRTCLDPDCETNVRAGYLGAPRP